MVSRFRRRLRKGFELPATCCRGEGRAQRDEPHPSPTFKVGIPGAQHPHPTPGSHVDKETENGHPVGAPGGCAEISVKFLIEVNELHLGRRVYNVCVLGGQSTVRMSTPGHEVSEGVDGRGRGAAPQLRSPDG